MDNPYSAPVSAVSDTASPRKWYVSFARFFCYPFLVIWGLSVFVSLFSSMYQFWGNLSFLAVAFFGATLTFFIFNYPLYAFLKLSGKNPDRKPTGVIWFNSLASLVVAGMFTYMAIVDPNEMFSMYVSCAVIFSFPYFLNAFSAYRIKRNT